MTPVELAKLNAGNLILAVHDDHEALPTLLATLPRWQVEGAAICLAAMLTPNLIPSVALAWLDGPATQGRRPALPSGTHAAHNRHKNNGTPPCPACIAGERLYQRDRKRATRAAA